VRPHCRPLYHIPILPYNHIAIFILGRNIEMEALFLGINCWNFYVSIPHKLYYLK